MALTADTVHVPALPLLPPEKFSKDERSNYIIFFFSVIYICFILFAVLLYLGHSLPSVLPSVLSQRTES